MKLLLDFFPILLFFIAYKLGAGWVPDDYPLFKENPIYLATLVAIVASVLQVSYLWLKHRKVENMHLVSLVLIVVFGGATLFLRDPQFIKWKPTVLNWLFGTVFLGSQVIGRKTMIERMLGGQLELPALVWGRLNLAWAAFFIVIGGVNLYVAYQFEEQVWVNFKLFGMLGLTFLFVILQSFYLSRYLPETKPEE
ncbi:intracellular septation protein [Methylomagnum ishizawai]|uniref:Inner membrane-spanning protein YciB n=1 Tax=Methylomagnum ishizawai TaxID=1760988 RepID=A0A1Y6D501_9GAMM|nr:septation protein A [Methylomagnum ishizawai]SMF95035.1 intracellular septation protein [Methylomagnum ishizawai]